MLFIVMCVLCVLLLLFIYPLQMNFAPTVSRKCWAAPLISPQQQNSSSSSSSSSGVELVEALAASDEA